MSDTELKRLSRLIAIQTQLQTRRLLTAPMLAEKFGVSVRTIYRDIKALEQAGLPIMTEEGKGYTLMDGYKIPPVMFTESEAQALIIAEQLVLKNNDVSLVKDYSEAIAKIKAVLRQSDKDKVNLLSDRTRFDYLLHRARSSNNLSELQSALTNFYLVMIDYRNQQGTTSSRSIEPFALVNASDNWLLLAWCRLREGFRFFRLDRIVKLLVLTEHFEPHQMTLQEYFEKH